jgi:hypothetical protein
MVDSLTPVRQANGAKRMPDMADVAAACRATSGQTPAGYQTGWNDGLDAGIAKTDALINAAAETAADVRACRILTLASFVMLLLTVASGSTTIIARLMHDWGW